MTTTITVTIEKEKNIELHKSARFRVRVAPKGGPALLMSTRTLGSVEEARREAERIFGNLAWEDNRGGPGEIVRARATTAFLSSEE